MTFTSGRKSYRAPFLGAKAALAIGLVAGVAVIDVAGAGAASRPAVRPDITGTLQQTLSDPGDNAQQEDDFGAAVAISGPTAIVGSSFVNNTEGAAYIYTEVSGTWTLTTTFSPPGAPLGGCFGCSVAISGSGPGTTAIVGAPFNKGGKAYIYVESAGGTWSTHPTATLSKKGAFGTSVAVSGTGPGTTAIVGSPETKRGKGNAYIFVESATDTWPTKPTVSLSNPGSGRNRFGLSVATSGSGPGTTAVVGAIGVNSSAGAADVYVEGTTDSVWPLVATLSDPGANTNHHDDFGGSVAVSGTGEGATTIIGTLGGGAAYAYVEGGTNGTWPLVATFGDPGVTAADAYGSAVAISGTGPGATAIVGENHDANEPDGAAYILTEGATTNSWTSTTLSDPGATVNDEFGGAVSVSGPTAIVGSEGFNSFAGAAYMYS